MQQNSKANIEDIYELSPLQQGILFHALYAEGTGAYIDQFCYNLSGELKEEFFRKAWQEIINRHPVFRTSFQWKGISKPVQIVNKSAELIWRSLDWSWMNNDQQKEEFKKFLAEDRADVFSFEKAPLMRCTLIKTGKDFHKFIWTFQHILVDGWSYPIIQKEVFAVYESLISGKEIDLTKPLPYKQFILWLAAQNKSAAERYWKSELKGFDSPTILNNYDPVKPSGNEDIAEMDLVLDNELTSKLLNLAKQNQLTLNTIVQGAWATILSSYSGEEDVVFGATVSGRNPSLKGVENMVGLFINTLPVRVKVDKTQKFIPWLKNIQTNHIERDEYSYSSLVDIHEWSDLPRNTQIFENILVFENYPLDKSLENGVAGIKIKDLEAFERTNFPLTIIIAPGEKLAIKFIYEEAKFSKEFIERVQKSLKNFLENAAESSGKVLSEISLISDEDKKMILNDWNDTKVDYDLTIPVHKLIEQQAKKTPGRIAIEFENKTMTYRELDELTNQIAHYLIELGVKPDTMVGICIDRSLEMEIGLLSIMKAGGAYVPMDPTYPQDRVDYMIEDSQIKIILSTENLSDVIKNHKAQTIFLDAGREKFKEYSKESPDVKISPYNMVYMIYTSGSTGNPKGVMNIHRGLSNQIQWIRDYLKCTAEDIVLQKTSFSFDVSTFELFMPLICGAKLVFAIPDGHKDNKYLLDVVNEKKITIIHFVTSMLAMFLEETELDKFKSVRLVVSSGEEVTIPVQTAFFYKFPEVELHDLYGPTETSVHVTYWKCDVNTKLNTVPIGKPVANTTAYVMDRYEKPVPVGVAGELHIGGVQVAKGYYHREELTRERFIKDIFSGVEGATLYKTGDLVRFMQDGNIEYFGRKDNQIKLRGFRIELGEIETVLSRFNGVRSSVVIARDHNGDKRLIAYIVPFENTELSVPEIREYLKEKLPPFMHPSDFVMIKEIPLTGSGKVNKNALPDPETMRAADPGAYEEPKDELQLQLVKIWEKVLGRKPIGIKDNFFEAGGHSLLALRLFGYIEKLTGKKLPLSVLFTSPTIEQLAVILKDEGWKPQWKSLVAVKPGGSKLPFFYVPPAGGTALEMKDFVKYLHADQPFYILESLGFDGKEKPHTEIDEMSTFYVKEIQSLQPEGPYLLGGRCFGGRVVFDVAQKLTKQGQKVALLSIFDTWPPFTEKPVDHIPQERNAGHFVSASVEHLKSGQFLKVATNYISYVTKKFIKKVKDKYELTFSSESRRRYNEIKQIHFRAQDRYIAKKFPGKITLIECEETKAEYKDKWADLAEGGLDYYVIPGTNHRSIVEEPHIRHFAEKLNKVLDEAQR